MLAGMILFAVGNSYEPQIDSQADFYEISLSVSQFVAGILGLSAAKRYRGSRVFGWAYLALGLGFILWGIGSTVYTVLNILGEKLPYPGFPDVFFVPYFLLLLFHLVTCTRYFKKKLGQKDMIILILLPVVVNIFYVSAWLYRTSISGSIPDLLSQQISVGEERFKLVPAESVTGQYERITVGNVTYALVPLKPASTTYPQIPQSNSPIDLDPIALSNLTVEQRMESGSQFWLRFFAGLFYNAITTLNLAWAILGMTVFRGSVLGAAWGLLLLGIALNATADIAYDFTTIYYYDRSNPTIPLWVFGTTVICYALCIHKKNI